MITYESGRLWRVGTLITALIYIQLSICMGPGWYTFMFNYFDIFIANITVLNYTGMSVV